jgi:uncharacterized protein (DUF1697 family)
MAALKKCLEEIDFADVSTYIASGNVMLASDKPADGIRARIDGPYQCPSKRWHLLLVLRRR